MESIPVSQFKATCLSVVQRVRRTGKPVLITRFGKPIAEVIPPRRRNPGSEWIGSMAGSAKEVGDIIAPVMDDRSWDVLRG